VLTYAVSVVSLTASVNSVNSVAISILTATDEVSGHICCSVTHHCQGNWIVPSTVLSVRVLGIVLMQYCAECASDNDGSCCHSNLAVCIGSVDGVTSLSTS